MKKEFGGLGVPNLQDINLCLLGSWVKRYAEGDGKLWKKIVDKYTLLPGELTFLCTAATPMSPDSEKVLGPHYKP